MKHLKNINKLYS